MSLRAVREAFGPGATAPPPGRGDAWASPHPTSPSSETRTRRKPRRRAWPQTSDDRYFGPHPLGLRPRPPACLSSETLWDASSPAGRTRGRSPSFAESPGADPSPRGGRGRSTPVVSALGSLPWRIYQNWSKRAIWYEIAATEMREGTGSLPNEDGITPN